MEETNAKRTLGIVLCSYFGLLTLMVLFAFFVDKFDLEAFYPLFQGEYTAYYDAAACLLLALIFVYAGAHTEIYTLKVGQVSAFVLAGIYALYMVTDVLWLRGVDVISIMGKYYDIVCVILRVIALALFLCSTRTVLAVMILGSLSMLPGVYTSLLNLRYRQLAEVGDYEKINEFLDSLPVKSQTSFYVYMGLVAITLIVTVIWLCQKKKAPYVATVNPDL